MSRHYSNDLIEEIKQANDIVSVISEYVSLKKKGKNYWGCCPFHNEKTPSFSVTPEKGFFYCFGCRASGNVINFLMRYDSLTFPEALERLAGRSNIVLPEIQVSTAERRRLAHHEELYKINEMAMNFFHNCLTKTSLGREGLDYLKGRGLTDKTINDFKLGFAPDSWDKLLTSFTSRGVLKEHLVELGLCREHNGKIYDYFRNRVMFPILDGKGRVLGFGGRVMDDATPKYLNSPETEIFDKGKILFAFNQSYRSIREEKQVILVEGYMDVLSAHNEGVHNVVASLGTAYTKDHGRLLMRQAEEIVLAYDMDGAGQTAAKRAIGLLQNTEFSVKVLAMPDGKDPDEYIKNHGGQAFKELVASASSDFSYLLNEALIHHDSNDPSGKEAILEELFPFISNEESSLRREEYLKALALPLYLDSSSIIQHYRQFVGKGKMNEGRQTFIPKGIKKDGPDAELLAMALNYEQVLQTVGAYLPIEDFHEDVYKSIFSKALDIYHEKGELLLSELEERLNDDEKEVLSRTMVSVDTEFDEERVNVLIRNIRLRSLREQFKIHSQLADKLQRANDPKFLEELKYCQEIQQLINEWS